VFRIYVKHVNVVLCGRSLLSVINGKAARLKRENFLQNNPGYFAVINVGYCRAAGDIVFGSVSGAFHSALFVHGILHLRQVEIFV
jgi:hypothetical protein